MDISEKNSTELSSLELVTVKADNLALKNELEAHKTAIKEKNDKIERLQLKLEAMRGFLDDILTRFFDKVFKS